MPSALQTVFTIQPATTDLSIRLGFVVFLRGPLRAHAAAVDDLWLRLNDALGTYRFTRYRLVGNPSWAALPETRIEFAKLFAGPLVGHWGAEFTSRVDDSGAQPNALWLQVSDAAPVRGMERASHIRVLFPEDVSIGAVAALGEWAITRVPLWWGSAGYLFHHTAGTMFTAHARIAALAKRYWAVQLLDMTTLQWEALRGMPTVNWLTLIGNEFASSKNDALDDISTALSHEGVFHRKGPNGVAFAAGTGPVRGDINIGENVQPYVNVARRIEPLLLTDHPPLFGPFAKQDVISAWLGRFRAPQRWLTSDISAD